MRSLAPQDETQVAINPLEFGPVSIEIASDVIPMAANFRTFDELTSDGIPSSDVPSLDVSCESDSPDCRLEHGGGGILVHIDERLLRSELAVLEFYYAAQTESDIAEGVNHYAASWAFRPS